MWYGVCFSRGYDYCFCKSLLRLFQGLRLFQTLEYILYSTKFICRQLTVFETLGLKKVVACILEVIANVEWAFVSHFLTAKLDGKIKLLVPTHTMYFFMVLWIYITCSSGLSETLALSKMKKEETAWHFAMYKKTWRKKGEEILSWTFHKM